MLNNHIFSNKINVIMESHFLFIVLFVLNSMQSSLQQKTCNKNTDKTDKVNRHQRRYSQSEKTKTTVRKKINVFSSQGARQLPWLSFKVGSEMPGS